MADICFAQLLPQDVTTVSRALDLLSTVESHACAVLGAKPRVIHARDLLQAEYNRIEMIDEVEGQSLYVVPPQRLRLLIKQVGAMENFVSQIRRGAGDRLVGPIFDKLDAHFLLASASDDVAMLVSRHEGLAERINAGACVCNGEPQHFVDSPPAANGKNCSEVGCSGKYRCY